MYCKPLIKVHKGYITSVQYLAWTFSIIKKKMFFFQNCISFNNNVNVNSVEMEVFCQFFFRCAYTQMHTSKKSIPQH